MTTALYRSSTTRTAPPRTLNGRSPIPSGRGWAARFPVSTTTRELTQPFRGNVERFLDTLRRAGAGIIISSTLRTKERGYLMHWSWRIVNQNVDPAEVPAMEGVNINWVHAASTAQASRQLGIAAAREMVVEFNIERLGVAPALRSRHMLGFGIDMTLQWSGNLSIIDAGGKVVLIDTLPRSGLNQKLHRVGASYGVIKYNRSGRDDPHWSDNGA